MEGVQNFTTVSVADLFRQFRVPRDIDYLSLDVEGAEYYCFVDFPWDVYKFWVITVERPLKLTKVLKTLNLNPYPLNPKP